MNNFDIKTITSGSLRNTARQLIQERVTAAINQSNENIKNAENQKSIKIAATQLNAKSIIDGIHGYYFVSKNSVSLWQPNKHTDPVKIHANFRPISDISVDEQNGVLLWSNKNLGAIMSASLEGGNPTTLYHCTAPNSVATDPSSNKIFWISNFKKIMMGDVSGETASEYLQLPTSSTYDGVLNLKLEAARDQSNNLLLFWADGTHIYKSSASKEFSSIYSSKDASPIYVAIDKVRSIVYWLDDKINAVCSCDFEGQNYQQVFSVPVSQVKGMSVNGSTGDLYYVNNDTDGVSNSIQKYDYEAKAVEKILDIKGSIGWGLSLHLTPANQALRQALKTKNIALETSNNNINAARIKAENQINEKEQEHSNAIDQAIAKIAQAKKQANDKKSSALQLKLQAEQNRLKQLQLANQAKHSKITEAEQKANQSINNAKQEAANNEAIARAKLEAARKKQREQGM